MRNKCLLILLWIGCCTVKAQTNPFLKDFQEFREGVKSDYQKFLEEANRGYVALLRGEWKETDASGKLIQPKEDKVKPIVLKEVKKEKPVEEKPVEEKPAPVEVKVTPVQIPEPTPQPEPVVPIAENKEGKEEPFSFSFFGTPMQARLDKQNHYSLVKCDKDGIADKDKQFIVK